jgi:hypothetical protein
MRMKNMGSIDRIIRIAVAIIIGLLYFCGVVSGTTALVLGLLAGVLLVTGVVSFCPLYLPCKITTVGKGQ